MMMRPCLEIEFLQGDPSKIWVKACNDSFAGATEQYLNPQLLEEFVDGLSLFPESISDEVTLKVGDAESSLGHFDFKFHCFDSVGHTAVFVSISDGRGNVAAFSVQFETLSLDTFVSSVRLALKSGSGVGELVGINPCTQNV